MNYSQKYLAKKYPKESKYEVVGEAMMFALAFAILYVGAVFLAV